MGLKTTNYKVEDYNLVLPTAYAKITNIEISPDGDAFTTFAIQQTREDISNNKPLIELRLATSLIITVLNTPESIFRIADLS